MTSSYPAQSTPIDDPDHGWKPNNRPQSTVARNFMSELDCLFNLDEGLEMLDKTVLEKKHAVTTQTRELEALEARLRAAEERLNQAKGNSPPARKDSQRRTPVEASFSDQDKARLEEASSSPLAQKSANMPAPSTDHLPDLVTPLIYRIHRQSRPCNFKGGHHLHDMDDVSEATLTNTFDELVSQAVIVYGPYESVKLEAEGYPLEFRICPALATKPHTVGATNHAFNQSRKWGPGSDMFCPDERLIVTQVNNTHDLALNLFCVDRPQLLMLTLDSYKRQHEALDVHDLDVMLQVLRKLPGIYVIFNCGERGGCSRVHKHLQGLKGPPYAFDYLISAMNDPEKKVPFQYFVHHFSQGFDITTAKDALSIYTTLLTQCRSLMDSEEQDTPPHNVIMWADHLIVVPRRTGCTEGASANAGGMLGSVWVTGQGHVDEWLRIGCANVLKELGVPCR
ncbi:hypothetical protein HRS9122_00717 [Pyrenophora teres f. teres]|nr:hypothetical protein HRS9122_00717 [Pyrenophora teres f. teres]